MRTAVTLVFFLVTLTIPPPPPPPPPLHFRTQTAGLNTAALTINNVTFFVCFANPRVVQLADFRSSCNRGSLRQGYDMQREAVALAGTRFAFHHFGMNCERTARHTAI